MYDESKSSARKHVVAHVVVDNNTRNQRRLKNQRPQAQLGRATNCARLFGGRSDQVVPAVETFNSGKWRNEEVCVSRGKREYTTNTHGRTRQNKATTDSDGQVEPSVVAH